MEAAWDAASISELFLRLEAAGQLLRIDRAVTPEIYRCAICTEADVEAMWRIYTAVRLGRVTALEPARIVLQRGAAPTTPQHVHINCSANGIPNKAPVPVFQTGLIGPQLCAPLFAHIQRRVCRASGSNA